LTTAEILGLISNLNLKLNTLEKMDYQHTTTQQQKIMLLRSRFKNTKDMWLYMSEKRKYLINFVLAQVSFSPQEVWLLD
jgi:hypothetical protein